MHAPTLISTVGLCFAVFLLSRKNFLSPLVVAACLLPGSEAQIIGGMEFDALRLIFFCSILRMILFNEKRSFDWNYFDKLFLFWCIAGTIVYIIQYGDSHAIIRKLGVLTDSLGLYWIFRHGIKDWDDINILIKVFAISALVLAPVVMIEMIQQRPSLYSIFGYTGTEYHRGRFRCAGPFELSILMGCFWGTLLPIFISRVSTQRGSNLYIFSIIAALALVVLSASSTPILGLISMILFWVMYKIRNFGNIIFAFVCFMVFLLNLAMKAPVWHLIARADVFSGSTGWHRFYLIDQFFAHLTEWFLLGTKSTAHWGKGLGDITNQYILEAVRGGFFTLVLFGMVIYFAIKITGKFSLLKEGTNEGWLSWSLCVSILGHSIIFLGVSYFGQIQFLLFFELAVVGFILEQYQKSK